jgi:hypothetical protein
MHLGINCDGMKGASHLKIQSCIDDVKLITGMVNFVLPENI